MLKQPSRFLQATTLWNGALLEEWSLLPQVWEFYLIVQLWEILSFHSLFFSYVACNVNFWSSFNLILQLVVPMCLLIIFQLLEPTMLLVRIFSADLDATKMKRAKHLAKYALQVIHFFESKFVSLLLFRNLQSRRSRELHSLCSFDVQLAWGHWLHYPATLWGKVREFPISCTSFLILLLSEISFSALLSAIHRTIATLNTTSIYSLKHVSLTSASNISKVYSSYFLIFTVQISFHDESFVFDLHSLSCWLYHGGRQLTLKP